MLTICGIIHADDSHILSDRTTPKTFQAGVVVMVPNDVFSLTILPSG
jgi:hypothetical protein